MRSSDKKVASEFLIRSRKMFKHRDKNTPPSPDCIISFFTNMFILVSKDQYPTFSFPFCQNTPVLGQRPKTSPYKNFCRIGTDRCLQVDAFLSPNQPCQITRRGRQCSISSHRILKPACHAIAVLECKHHSTVKGQKRKI